MTVPHFIVTQCNLLARSAGMLSSCRTLKLHTKEISTSLVIIPKMALYNFG